MKRIISCLIILVISIGSFAACKSGLEKTLSLADKIDEKYNNYVKSEPTTITTTTVNNVTTIRQTTVEITLNEPYYIKYNPEKEYVAMYEKADTNSKVLKEFYPNGKKTLKVIVLNKENKNIWKVKYKGKTGYIHKSNLTEKKQKATTSKFITRPKTTTTKKSIYIPKTTQWTSQYRKQPTNQNNYSNNQKSKSKNTNSGNFL